MTLYKREQIRKLQDKVIKFAEARGLKNDDKIGEFTDNNGHFITLGDLRRYIYPQWENLFKEILL